MYCKICKACGEDGCCQASSCQMHPDGEYCEYYHLELRFGYKMYHKLMELIEGDEEYSEQVG